MEYIGEPSFPLLQLFVSRFILRYGKITDRKIKSFNALIDTAGKKLSSTQASFKILFVLVIDAVFKSQCQLSLPLTIPYVDLSAI